MSTTPKTVHHARPTHAGPEQELAPKRAKLSTEKPAFMDVDQHKLYTQSVVASIAETFAPKAIAEIISGYMVIHSTPEKTSADTQGAPGRRRAQGRTRHYVPIPFSLN